jgi:hypothetical protein
MRLINAFNQWIDSKDESDQFALFMVPMMLVIIPLPSGIVIGDRTVTIFSLVVFAFIFIALTFRAMNFLNLWR